MPASASTKLDPRSEFSLSVSRALRILSSFSREHPEWGLSELSRMMDLSKGSVSRFLQALEMHGYVDRDPQTRLYRPGPEVARVGSLYHSAGRLRQFAMPIMRDLVQRVGEPHRFVGGHPPEDDGHQEGRRLVIGDPASGDAGHEEVDLLAIERASIALLRDDVDNPHEARSV